MSLRFFTLVYCINLTYVKKSLFFLLVLGFGQIQGQTSSMDDVNKEAEKLFKNEQYSQAYKLYSQLVSNFPKDPEYNFKLGVCMIYSEPDKKKCLPYLKFAAENADEDTKNVEFYLAKAYHINYLFDQAIKSYNAFKLVASASQVKKFEVDREIKACTNGKHLLSNLTDLEVISKTELPESDYFRNYKKIGGKLLVKPDDFKTGTDKKKKEKSVVFLPNGSNVVYFSSYGENTDNGKDLYTAAKLPDGTFGKPEKVKGLNTEFDEDYPFLHPDGKTLYFASKGHNSMGGYDIFKSIYNEGTNSWGSPINLEFPINSPDDDYLFVTDSLETQAYFSTGRQSPPGKIDVLKVKTKRRPLDILAVKGNVIQGSPEHSLKSTIIVKDLFTQNEIGTFNSEDDGSYTMELPNGAKLVYTVETPDLETQTAQVTLPETSASKPYKQTISYENGKLKILNYFDEAVNDDTYLQYLNVIEKKAKLDVNEGKTSDVPLATNNPEKGNTDSSKTQKEVKKPQIVGEEQSIQTETAKSTDSKKGLDNKQLAKMARQDADESKQEAKQLNRDFIAANEAGLKQKEEADKNLTQANEAIVSAESISNEDERKTALETANALKQTAENDQLVASKILSLAKSLDSDSKMKQQEADLNLQYANELEKSMRLKDNKESLAKLDQLQKEINDLSLRKNQSEDVVNSIKGDIEQKEKQISIAESGNQEIKTNLEEIKTAITDKENEITKTKKKSAKQNLSAQISELKVDKEEKEKQITRNETEIKSLNDELGSLKSELEIATKITSEDIAVTNETKLTNEKVTNSNLQERYKNKIVVADASNKSTVDESIIQLKSFNKEIDEAITKNKSELAKTKNKQSKQELLNEIKLLETSKKQNQQQISVNTKLSEDLGKTIVKNSEPVSKTFEPIIANNSVEAATKLDNLVTQLSISEAENFDYNGYQNPTAQNLKVEADAKINDALAKQKKLKEDIVASKVEIEKTGGGNPLGTVSELTKQGDDFSDEAKKLRTKAQTKKGNEKSQLLEEVKSIETKANDTYLKAADVTRNDNAVIVAVNQENIQNLITENKSSEGDLKTAKLLNEEAKLALKKAADIRLESNSLTNSGAKLGSYSNAEEKEAEAILKQNKAIELLTKSNPGFQLKSPVTSTSTVTEKGGGSDQNLNSKLETVNAGLSELARIKIESYQKLYEANTAEIDQLTSDIKDQQTVVDNTPSLKTELLSSNNKLENAKTLKQSADNSANTDEKINNLISSIKKQNESIKQLSKLNTTVVQLSSKTSTTASSTLPDPNNTTQNPSNVNTSTGVGELGELASVNTGTVEVSQLAQQDTTTEQVITYLNTNKTTLRNPEAGTIARVSLNKLEEYESQNAKLNADLDKANKRLSNGESSPATSKDLAQKAEALSLEAEPLSNKSAELKKEAAGKEGEDKNYLLAQARELDIQAQDKLIESADYKQQANESEYTTNQNAISELIDKLKTDNPTLSAEMQTKRSEYEPLKTQIQNLRNEANALNNKAAKIGALSNAEEKEIELNLKQAALLDELKKQYPDYVVKQVTLSPEEEIADLQQKRSAVREKQFTELTNLTNAYSLEYESSKNSIPGSLNADQQLLRQNAEDLNSESKKLLIRSAQEKNENEKIKLLTLASKSGNAAIEQLNKLLPKNNSKIDGISELEAIGENILLSNSGDVNAVGSPKTTNTKGRKNSLKIDGLEVVQGNAYTAANPIPIDAPMEGGLVFRVQIGAFKTQLPNNAFKGLSPLNGETTNNGYFRYTAGNFNKIENANAVKNDLRNLGYQDAFVVVYYNGKRITLGEALAQMEKDGTKIDPAAPQTAGITANANVPRAAVNTAVQESVVVTKELEQIDGLLYTIQIGVYAKQISKPQLLSLKPIFREQLTNGLYRYTAGIYNNPERLLLDKTKVTELGVRDAFVSAYLNGKRIPFAEAKDRQSTDGTLKMEPENPIVFPEQTVSAPNPLDQLLSTSTIEPFKNDVKNYPAATPENGIKETEEGICFKVQIGAFSKQVPDDIAAKFASIKSWPIDHKQINGLFVYVVGNFSEAKYAKSLKEELIRQGITDAFVTVYKNSRKLYGPEAEGYMR